LSLSENLQLPLSGPFRPLTNPIHPAHPVNPV
jgi:hypothetical protein